MKSRGVVVSGKRLQIEKAGSKMFIAVIVASVIVSFSVVFLNFLWGAKKFNDTVLAEKNMAKDTLEQNVANVEALRLSFQSLDQNETVNATTILDALPSVYDFPALATSIEALVKTNERAVSLESFSGQDQQGEAENTSPEPQPVEMPFTMTIGGPYANIQQFIGRLEATIRPMHVTQITLSGVDDDMKAELQIKTFYQPAQSLEPTKKGDYAMKQTDLALLVLIIAISLTTSYFVSKAVVNKPENRTAQVEVVQPISTTFPSPNENPLSEEADAIYNKIFTKDSVNPTQQIQIGPGDNQNPFGN